MSEEEITPDDGASESVATEGNVTEESAPVEKTWRDSLPDELRGIKTLEKFKDVDGLAKSYVETEKYFEGAIRIPGENASEEEKNSYYSKLGRPDTAEGYDLTKADMPEGMAYDDTFEQAFLGKAHKAGLNNAQVGELYEWYNGATKEMFVQNTVNSENTIQKAEIELRADWGRQYDEKLAGVQRLVEQYASPEDVEYLNTGPGNDKKLARMLDRIAKDHGEGRHLGDPKVNAFTDPDSAQKAKDAFYNDTKSEDYKAYFDASHPDHAKVVKMLSRWNETIHGSD
tara:strand:+ start:420 stop:1274 length:855 start_codon:yes stop_codon:yes gene_type:complete